MAFLNKGLKIIYVNGTTQESETFHYAGGMLVMLSFEQKNVLHEKQIYVDKVVNEMRVEVAIRYTDAYSKAFIFCKQHQHSFRWYAFDRFKNSITRVFNEYIKKNNI